MSESSLPAGVAANPLPWNPDEIFRMLAEPARRRVLLVLAGGAALPASCLTGTTHLRVDATLKHLTTLCKAGVLTATTDPQDRRRLVYALTKSVPVVRTATGTALDFGCCIVPCSGQIRIADTEPAGFPVAKD